MARSARDGGPRTAAGARFSFADDGSLSVISGRGVRGVVGGGVDALDGAGGVRGEAGMAHCGVVGDAGATARRLAAVGERGGVARDSGLDGVVRGMVRRTAARGNQRGGGRERPWD